MTKCQGTPKPSEVGWAPQNPKLFRLGQKTTKTIDSSMHKFFIGLMDRDNIQKAHWGLATKRRQVGNDYHRHGKAITLVMYVHGKPKESWIGNIAKCTTWDGWNAQFHGNDIHQNQHCHHWHAQDPTQQDLFPTWPKQQWENLPTSRCPPSMWQECIIALHWLRLLPQASPSFNLQVDRRPTPQTSETPKRLVQLNAWQTARRREKMAEEWGFLPPWKSLPPLTNKVGFSWMIIDYPTQGSWELQSRP